ncbi:conserved protein of unknown function [Ruminococcaceae bacterium BL-6]|nr:conserved protein of unknown function [Ruminococcaceae bacterium BL-6]
MEEIIFTSKRGTAKIGGAPPYILNSFDPGAPKSTLITTKAPGQDGKTVESQLLEERTPSITLTIHADNVDDLYQWRRKLFAIFSPKLSGILQYTNNAGTRTIPCIVDGEPTAKDRKGRGQQILIQLFCPDPYWLDTAESKAEMALWAGDFYFPLVIPVDTGAIMGHRMSNLIVNAYNPGDVACGIRIEFTALASVETPSILNVDTRELMKVKRTMAAGDKLIINTAFGNETVKLNHSGIESNAMNYIDLDSDFFQLYPGDNLLRYDANSGIDNLECAIYYRPKYGEA